MVPAPGIAAVPPVGMVGAQPTGVAPMVLGAVGVPRVAAPPVMMMVNNAPGMLDGKSVNYISSFLLVDTKNGRFVCCVLNIVLLMFVICC